MVSMIPESATRRKESARCGHACRESEPGHSLHSSSTGASRPLPGKDKPVGKRPLRFVANKRWPQAAEYSRSAQQQTRGARENSAQKALGGCFRETRGYWPNSPQNPPNAEEKRPTGRGSKFVPFLSIKNAS